MKLAIISFVVVITTQIGCDKVTKKQHGAAGGSREDIKAPAAPVEPQIAENRKAQSMPPASGDMASNDAGIIEKLDPNSNRHDLDFKEVHSFPLSTVSVDIDTASYSFARGLIKNGQRVDSSQIRMEEFINYFDYNLEDPKEEEPFSVTFEESSSPWNSEHRFARISLNTKSLPAIESGRNFVFLIDVSGSMGALNKLPLLREAFKLLVSKLDKEDTISIVTYAGSNRVVLEGESGANKEAMIKAIDNLKSGGSTNGAGGIQKAYELANKNFIPGGVNRVILATDGDFNVGVRSPQGLIDLIKKESENENSIFLTILSFGYSSQGGGRMEELSNAGNGNYFMIDSTREAKKVLSRDLTANLVTVAKDVKAQLEFNPRLVKSWRLIGYYNRRLKDEEFNNDSVDAGDLGVGHQVTWLVEYLPLGEKQPKENGWEKPEGVDPLIYRDQNGLTERAKSEEIFALKVRYKEPDGEKSALFTQAAHVSNIDFASQASPELKWIAAVTSFAAKLADLEPFATDWDNIKAWAEVGIGEDIFQDRSEFIELIDLAAAIYKED